MFWVLKYLIINWMNWLLVQRKMSFLLLKAKEKYRIIIDQYCSCRCRIDNRLMHVFTQLAVRAEEAEEKNRKLKREVCSIIFWAILKMFILGDILNLPPSVTSNDPFHYISYITFSSQLLPWLIISFSFCMHACYCFFILFFPCCHLLSLPLKIKQLTKKVRPQIRQN